MKPLWLQREASIRTPAKVNLHLFVQGQRPDGYHDLELDLVPISLYDRIDFIPFEQEGLWFVAEPELCAPEDNLAIKALKALEAECSVRFNLALKLTKQIPSGAGLGGGSGNAAGVLVALNHLFGLGLPQKRLLAIAARLGADVPFFIEPRPAQARGIGEVLSPLEIQGDWPLLLVKPEVSISTAQAYQLAAHSARKLPQGPYGPALIEALQASGNDFFAPLAEAYPALAQIHQLLEHNGAQASLLSGSGSCLFGIFKEAAQRDRALERIGGLMVGEVFAARFLTGHDYGQGLAPEAPAKGPGDKGGLG